MQLRFMCKLLFSVCVIVSSVMGYAFDPYPINKTLSSIEPIKNGERHLVVVTCSYNNAAFCKHYMESIAAQKYDNYHVLYIDDCSNDGTSDIIEELSKEYGIEDKMIIIRNRDRRKALANLYYGIQLCHPKSIVLIVDGDDRLHQGEQVFQYINQVYAQDIWLTYGQFIEWYPKSDRFGGIGFCKAYMQYVIEGSRFRYVMDSPSHLRTFYAALFHKINQDDLLFQGKFFDMTYDLAIMFPMLEMAGTHHQFISTVLLDYNISNPISDHRVDKKLQRKYDLIIRARTCYRPIAFLFEDTIKE